MFFHGGGLLGDDGSGERVTVDVIAQPGEYAGRRDAIGDAVVDLDQDRPTIALEAFDEPAFPQRAVPVQSALQHVGDHPEQFVVVTRTGHRQPADVTAEVESRIVDPMRCTDVEGLGA